jgi:hypothetical protein
MDPTAGEPCLDLAARFQTACIPDQLPIGSGSHNRIAVLKGEIQGEIQEIQNSGDIIPIFLSSSVPA